MQYLLSRSFRSMLQELARENLLCAFDFDGTLSPIVEHPDRARMRPRTRKLLGRLTSLYPCVIVSGRARADLVCKLSGLPVARAIGNHGAETESAQRGSRRRIKGWKAALDRRLGTLPGVWIEDKGLSLAVHYRKAANKAEARCRILASAQEISDARVLGGKDVVNLVLDRAPHKGDALAAERVRLGCQWLLYVGDDENDEDAFALPGNVIPVRIGQKRKSHARYYLRAQSEIDDLIELLVRLKPPAVSG
jgi:trehalose 6-phosphate phosphatase